VAHQFPNADEYYAGPLTLRLTRSTSRKACITIFVCLATKVFHILLVSDNTSSASISASSRVTARCGTCQHDLAHFHHRLGETITHEDITNARANRSIKFRFIPPRLPDFSGLWKVAVKATKHHLRRIVGHVVRSFEEMTVLARIEVNLNSRPFVPDPKRHAQAWAPSHRVSTNSTHQTKLPRQSHSTLAAVAKVVARFLEAIGFRVSDHLSSKARTECHHHSPPH
jgi:hypothetical protein